MSDYPNLTLCIGDQKIGTDAREAQDVIDPATEEVIGQVPHATTDDLDTALSHAESGFRDWRATDASKREKVLRKAAALIRERTNDIAAMLTREQGKIQAEAKGELGYVANLFEFYAGECQRNYGRTLVRQAPKRAEVMYVPVGPVAGFAPWNFPALNVARKVGGPIAAGCSVIVKPSEETPAAGLAVVQALRDAGCPDNVVQCVFGVPEDISSHLLASPIIRKLTFTGSTAVGKHLAKLAAEDLKVTTMELGGHGPVLIFDDADIESALDTMAPTAYRNAGQVCVSPTRFIIDEPVFERFRDGFVERVEKITVGNGFDDGVAMGPLANDRQLNGIIDMIANAREKGAGVPVGGERIGNRGFFHAPTVLTDVPEDADMMQDEPFGPVAILNRYAGEEAMIAEANRLPYGLAAYGWTQSPARRRRMAEQVEAGMLAINGANVSTVDAPFGGVKWSGYGHEDGAEGVKACLVAKTVHEG